MAETHIRVLDQSKKGKTHKGYYGVYNSPLQDAVIFDYRKGRSREGPAEMLRKFKGYLQSDGCKVYDLFGEKEEITLLNGCEHARRYFKKAKEYNQNKAGHVIKYIQKLYLIERFGRNAVLSVGDRKTLRLDHALPIINDLDKGLAG